MSAENVAKVDAAVDESSVPVPIQVERLRAEFELEKQRIANRGQWFGGAAPRRFVWNATITCRGWLGPGARCAAGSRLAVGRPKGLALTRSRTVRRSPKGCRPTLFWPAILTAEGDSPPSRWREGRGDGWPPAGLPVIVAFHTKRHRAFGASIGVLGAVAVAGIGLIFRPASLEPIPPSKQIVELEEKRATLAKQFNDLSGQLSAEQSLQQKLRAEISDLNKQLGVASGVQQKLNEQIKQLQAQQKSSPQTLLTVYPFSRKGSVEDCRERAVGAIAELGFKRLSSPNPDVVAGNGEDVAAILCVTGSIVIAGPEGDYLMQSVKWLQSRMQSK